ncbi:MAG: hypothetical protein RR420_00805 [Anaerovoracaceae bacterium]
MNKRKIGLAVKKGIADLTGSRARNYKKWLNHGVLTPKEYARVKEGENLLNIRKRNSGFNKQDNLIIDRDSAIIKAGLLGGTIGAIGYGANKLHNEKKACYIDAIFEKVAEELY